MVMIEFLVVLVIVAVAVVVVVVAVVVVVGTVVVTFVIECKVYIALLGFMVRNKHIKLYLYTSRQICKSIKQIYR